MVNHGPSKEIFFSTTNSQQKFVNHYTIFFVIVSKLKFSITKENT